jgi:hypothetical protein
MTPLDQVTVPAQDRVRPYQQQEFAQLLSRQAVEQTGEHYAIRVGEHGFADLALWDGELELVAQGEDLNVLSRSLMGSSRKSVKVLATARSARRSSATDHDAARPPCT